MNEIRCDIDKEVRIDKYLRDLKLPELFSRSRIEKLLESGKVSVNGEVAKKSQRIQSGDVIKYELPKLVPQKLLAEDIPLNIVYEDDYLAVLNKPAGLTVHPGAGQKNGTLVNALLHRYGSDLSKGFQDLRPGIVHRLDKDTSGLIIVARQDETHFHLSRQFQNRQVRKKYLAITVAVPQPVEGRIEGKIGRSKTNRKKMSIVSDGREALSLYKVLEDYQYFSLVEIELKTGRTHQIRVHLDSIGCPVLADTTYSTKKRTLNSVPEHFRKRVDFLLTRYIKRQALHAYYLEFEHPVSGERLSFSAEMPDDMVSAKDYIQKIIDYS